VKILHLLSNYRWTERAEPAVLLARAERQAGHNIAFASGEAPAGVEDAVQPRVAALGLESIALELPKHIRVLPALRDARALAAYIDSWSAEVVHCHMAGAHITAALARRRSARKPRIVRMCYEPEGLENSFREAALARWATDGLIVTTPEARDATAARFTRLRNRIEVIEPGIDLERFSPDRALSAPPEPTALPPNAFVVGIVSRLRKARRLDLVIGAIGQLTRDCPDLHLLIVGRGGSPEKVEEAVTQPAREAGCLDRVHLAGYRTDDALVAAYRRMNVLAYPEPGTDRSCRTVREAMAAGLPVVAARVGYLPHLIEHEATGLLAEQSADDFARALRRLYDNRDTLRGFATNSLNDARRRFGLDQQARQTLAFYETL